MIATHALLGPEAYADPAYFAREMKALGERSWMFACLTDDVDEVDDWVRRTIFGVDVVVQNFKGEVRAFENLCTHRYFPIRRGREGNGTLRCGFHAWTFNRDGIPTGIPRNAECFGLSREDQTRLALRRFRVATMGRFLFVSLGEAPPPLREFLGRYAPLLETVSALLRGIRHTRVKPSRANWKHSYELVLEDYHAQAVHPDTFGSVVSPLPNYFYDREGPHSFLMKRRDPDWSFDYFWNDLPANKLDTSGYKIFNLFPNTYFSLHRHWMFMGSFVPRGPGETSIETHICDWASHPLDDDTVQQMLSGYHIIDEDQEVAEGMQASAWGGQPRLIGALEQRIGWFHDAHAAIMGTP